MDEWVVYRIHEETVGCAPATVWDVHVDSVVSQGYKTNLTLLARGLTQEQAKAMEQLANDGEDDEI